MLYIYISDPFGNYSEEWFQVWDHSYLYQNGSLNFQTLHILKTTVFLTDVRCLLYCVVIFHKCFHLHFEFLFCSICLPVYVCTTINTTFF